MDCKNDDYYSDKDEIIKKMELKIEELKNIIIKQDEVINKVSIISASISTLVKNPSKNI